MNNKNITGLTCYKVMTDLLSSKCPILSRYIQGKPGSFWIRKIK